jgi:squalene synthase HpnC
MNAAAPRTAESTPAPAIALPDRSSVMAQAGAENFPVAGLVLGREARRHLLAIYGFARLVDDVGDEVEGDRGAMLDEIERQLEMMRCGGRPIHPVLVELARTMTACGLTQEPLRRLIAANRQDQRVTRYQTLQELLDYCRLSAAPVGELVLGVFGLATPERIALSDSICAALQITEHLQDLREDFTRGRIYLPAEDLARFGCEHDDFDGPPGPGRRALLQFEIARTRRLFDRGAPLVRTLPPRPRVAVAGFLAGGRAALDELARHSSGASPAGARDGRRRRRLALLGELPRALAGR